MEARASVKVVRGSPFHSIHQFSTSYTTQLQGPLKPAAEPQRFDDAIKTQKDKKEKKEKKKAYTAAPVG